MPEGFPHILYLHSHDTGRYVQPYGHQVLMPNVQALADQGVLFRQAFCAAPTCSASTIFSATLPAGTLPGSYLFDCPGYVWQFLLNGRSYYGIFGVHHPDHFLERKLRLRQR